MKAKTFLKSGLTGLCVFFTSYGVAMNKTPTKFDWYATESAPKLYPMEIIRGTFFYKDQTEGLYIPSGGTICKKGWGTKVSHHVVGPDEKPLPDRVKIVFYSYAEKQFYKGEFTLPYDKILATFREHLPFDPDLPYFSSIQIGIAPGGAVAVWLDGVEIKEVFFGQAEKVDIDPSVGFNLPFDSKAESDTYIEKQLVNVLTPEQLASLKKNGIPFGTWARYRNLYKWAPTYKDGLIPIKKETTIWFINGEKTPKVPIQFSEELANTPRPLPRGWTFTAPTISGKKYVYDIKFEEFELMAAFEKLGAKGERVNIEIEPREPITSSQVRVYNNEESIVLTKTTF